jgi:hypothetical protein
MPEPFQQPKEVTVFSTLRIARVVVCAMIACFACEPLLAQTTLISNLPGNDGTQTANLSATRNKGMGFTMPTGQDYILVSVTLRLETFGIVAPVVELWTDSGGLPGVPIETLTNPIFAISGISNYDFTSSGTVLTAGTSYWIVAYGVDGAARCDWKASSPPQNPTGLAAHLGALFDTDGPPPTVTSSVICSYSVTATEWHQPPDECAGPELLYYQTPHDPADPWNAYTSGETTSFDYTVFDNFDGTHFSITDFHWWGLSLFWNGAGWDPCDPTGMTFDISFYSDSGGLPGAAVCTYSGLSPTAVPGSSYGGYTGYYWDVTGLSPACEPSGASWVSIHSYPNASGCVLLWLTGTGGDANLVQWDGSSYAAQSSDAAMCITGPPLFTDDFETGSTSRWSLTVP